MGVSRELFGENRPRYIGSAQYMGSNCSLIVSAPRGPYVVTYTQVRLRRVPVNDESIRIFFKFELFIASVKIQREPFRMTIHQDN